MKRRRGKVSGAENIVWALSEIVPKIERTILQNGSPEACSIRYPDGKADAEVLLNERHVLIGMVRCWVALKANSSGLYIESSADTQGGKEAGRTLNLWVHMPYEHGRQTVRRNNTEPIIGRVMEGQNSFRQPAQTQTQAGEIDNASGGSSDQLRRKVGNSESEGKPINAVWGYLRTDPNSMELQLPGKVRPGAYADDLVLLVGADNPDSFQSRREMTRVFGGNATCRDMVLLMCNSQENLREEFSALRNNTEEGEGRQRGSGGEVRDTAGKERSETRTARLVMVAVSIG
ncbi:hypothetical protein HHI36_018318 [Cryptolaemus montrouzieri]|uniref:Uncharacterized protein n=1 Tax=Cryptolaemus montrouzieri TaxID=559131 RepID=A0ABD2P0W2_9CUCU